MHDEVMDWTPFWNAQTLSAACDLDLAPDTPSCRDNHFCQIPHNSRTQK